MPEKVYPRYKYHPDYEPIIVQNEEEEDELEGWHDSPADYGVFTAPSADQLKFSPKKSE